MSVITGIVLAAGAGTRAGGPKALRVGADGRSWIAHSVDMLLAAGASRVVVVLGASSTEARALTPGDATVVIAKRWADGMSESLRAGLAASTGDAALITLVDLPELPVSVAHRVLSPEPTADTLRQAVFGGRPGHPVVVGSAHWADLTLTLSGDRGARPYLAANRAEEVECGDLDSGEDLDGPDSLG